MIDEQIRKKLMWIKETFSKIQDRNHNDLNLVVGLPVGRSCLEIYLSGRCSCKRNHTVWTLTDIPFKNVSDFENITEDDLEDAWAELTIAYPDIVRDHDAAILKEEGENNGRI